MSSGSNDNIPNYSGCHGFSEFQGVVNFPRYGHWPFSGTARERDESRRNHDGGRLRAHFSFFTSRTSVHSTAGAETGVLLRLALLSNLGLVSPTPTMISPSSAACAQAHARPGFAGTSSDSMIELVRTRPSSNGASPNGLALKLNGLSATGLPDPSGPFPRGGGEHPPVSRGGGERLRVRSTSREGTSREGSGLTGSVCLWLDAWPASHVSAPLRHAAERASGRWAEKVRDATNQIVPRGGFEVSSGHGVEAAGAHTWALCGSSLETQYVLTPLSQFLCAKPGHRTRRLSSAHMQTRKHANTQTPRAHCETTTRPAKTKHASGP
eukprot:2700747-Rhodomonas_salina.1